MATFWSKQYGREDRDPKRGFRFKITFEGLNDGEIVWFAKKVGKPGFSITEVGHSYLNHKFYFPGRVEWEPISMTLVDPVSPGAVAQTNALVVSSGYQVPGSATDLQTISKGKSNASIGNIQIDQIDADGAVVESWSLKNVFVKSLKFGELAYESDELIEIELELRYDWAVCEIGDDVDGARQLADQQGVDPKTFYSNN